MLFSFYLRYHSFSVKMGGPSTTTFGNWLAVFYLFHMEMWIQSVAFLLMNLFYKDTVLLWRKTRLLPCDFWRTILSSIIGVDKIDIEESLNESCRNARTRYATFLDKKKKIEMETKKELERRQTEKNSETEIEQLERDRNIIRKGICIAESCIEEGNTELREVMKVKVINRERLISCQTKISMGVKKKTELSEEL